MEVAIDGYQTLADFQKDLLKRQRGEWDVKLGTSSLSKLGWKSQAYSKSLGTESCTLPPNLQRVPHML